MSLMQDKKIEIILIKYFTKSASTKEMIELTDWIGKQSDNFIFKDYIKTNYLIDINMFDFDTEEGKEKVLRKIKRDEKSIHKNKVKTLLKYAAILIVTFGLGYIYLTEDFSIQNKQNITTNTEVKIQPGSDKAILTLEDGKQVKLAKGETYTTEKVRSNGENLIYLDNKQASGKKIAYNYLTIPRGGQFYVELSDGTKVWLNSESKLKYPIAFEKGKPRRVELIYGEAFFDVSSSENHAGSSFKVLNQIQEIEVLGTEFNLKAYQGEDEIATTLVEGKVSINNGLRKEILKPNQQSLLNIKTEEIQIATVDVFDVISWKKGLFSFKEKPLIEIMNVLSRWYDVDVSFDNDQLKHINFSGVFNKKQNIDEILLIFQDTNTATFEIKNKTITVK